ncbi:MAG: LytR C-terminal domain-containing protein [Candidatus Shapirobacteria bacterium]|nr:LytR C-terminal domain-containing protein [Candidatus Shapirobacteria bacterium]
MSLFSKPKVVLWPKDKSLEIYINLKENNHFTLDINLWQENSDKDLEPLIEYLQKNKIKECTVLISDDIVLTKSFIYDTQIEQIDKKEVIGLAESFVSFKIDPNSINYVLIQESGKTIIQSTIFEVSKMSILKANLAKLNIQINALNSVSAAISKVLSSIYSNQFFLIYPLNDHEYTLLLSKNNTIYLTANFKGPALDIQKTINYSNLYFSTPAKKIYFPESKDIEIITTTEVEKTAYNESQIAQNLNKPANFPLPVLGEFSDIIAKAQDINSSGVKKMNNKKNILPIIAVLIFTAALVSFIVYFVFNNKSNNEENMEDITPTSIIEEITPTATPTLAEIDKTIKLQVLNATDINGQAATLKSKLVNLGFENVTVGNSTTKATENTVQVKSATTSAYFESVLRTDFPATYTTDLKSTSTYDAVFIIGTDLSTGESASTPTIAPTEAEE